MKKVKDKTITPRSRIVVSLRKLWLQSRERSLALQRDNYTCRKCHRKQSKAKGKEFSVQVHHLTGIEWEEMIKFIRQKLLIHHSGLITICKECHLKEHKKEEKK